MHHEVDEAMLNGHMGPAEAVVEVLLPAIHVSQAKGGEGRPGPQ